jgi:CRP/FNR family transcriptional regulator, polysaccharide utilization system transcription regulator
VDQNIAYLWEAFEELLTSNQRALLELFKSDGRVTHHEKADVLFFDNQKNPGFYWLMRGVGHCASSKEGTKESLLISGDFIGLSEMLEKRPMKCEFRFNSLNNILMFIPENCFLVKQQETPGMVIPLIKRIHTEVTQLESRALNISQTTSEKRLYFILDMLRERFGSDHDNWVPLKLSMDDLAEMIGASKNTLMKKLRELRINGILEIENNHFRISSDAYAH